MTPRTLILRTAGTNCDVELAHAFRLAGAEPVTVHLHRLIDDPGQLDTFDLIGIPGGFSYGDDIAAGRIFANRLKHRLLAPLREAIARGVPVIGPCNGFQVMVKLGLLPDPHADGQQATLSHNPTGRFVARWVPVVPEAESRCIWTRGLGAHTLPIAHGEGRFIAPDAVLDSLETNGQIALRYTQPVNGSARDIAGICDPTGLLFGLMPHPERYLHPTNHPHWTRLGQDFLTHCPEGLRYFENAVQHVRETQGTAAMG